MDSSLHLVPGRYKLPNAPGGSLSKDSPGWEKAENKFTATSGLPACVCVCVCVLCGLHICTCVFQCVVCAIKNLTKVLIIICLRGRIAGPSTGEIQGRPESKSHRLRFPQVNSY